MSILKWHIVHLIRLNRAEQEILAPYVIITEYGPRGLEGITS